MAGEISQSLEKRSMLLLYIDIFLFAFVNVIVFINFWKPIEQNDYTLSKKMQSSCNCNFQHIRSPFSVKTFAIVNLKNRHSSTFKSPIFRGIVRAMQLKGKRKNIECAKEICKAFIF